MDYTIAGIRVSITPELTDRGGNWCGLPPFADCTEGPADLTIEASDKIAVGSDYTELDTFDFSDVASVCHFGRDAGAYILKIAPENGKAPALFRKAFGVPVATTDFNTQHHHPALFRFGAWMMFNLAAVERQSVAVHTSTICCNNEAVLFLGESGTGKSTHTRLWREHIEGARLLNDDSPIIHGPGNGEVTAFGSPWSGKTHCYLNENYPVRAIVRLSQAPHNSIRRLRPIEAIGALLPSCPPQFAHDEVLHDAICAIVSNIVGKVPIYHLECLPDAEAAELSFKTVFGQ